MWWLVILIVLGVLFLLAELLILPGLSVGAFLAMACYGGAIWYAFETLGVTAGVWIIVVVAVASLLSLVFSLRAKTWQRLALNQNIESTSMPSPEKELSVGAEGITLSRLAPMGKVNINGKIYEAKSFDGMIDPKVNIEVVGFDNFDVIVKQRD